jgi:nucleoside-diphosphate-sugar epimerase
MAVAHRGTGCATVRVFVAGATGAIGRPLMTALLTGGHEPIAMTRSAEKATALRARGIEACVCDAYDAPGLARAIAEARPDQIVHLLTDLPHVFNMRRFEQETASTGRLRRVGTANLIAAATAAGVERIVAESIAFTYAPVGDWVKSEDAPLALEALPSAADPVADLERQVQAVGGIVLRYGWLYGPGTAYTRDGSWAYALRRRQLPIIGQGAGVFSFVHVEDAASATVAALEHRGPAVYNVVDDEPAPLHEWVPAFAQAIGAPKPWHAPVWLGRLAAGRLAVEMLGGLRGASNERVKRELGWQPRYASWREGFQTGLG